MHATLSRPPGQRKPRQRRPHERSAAVLIRPSAGQPDTLLRITQDGEPAHYWLSALPADFGRAFRLEKPGHEGDDAYDVLLDDQGGDSCTCPGHVYHSFCKHVDCLRALLQRGDVPDDPKLTAYKPASHDNNIPF